LSKRRGAVEWRDGRGETGSRKARGEPIEKPRGKLVEKSPQR